MHKKIVGIIPARYASTRFPGKPLALIAGKPMIVRVYQSAAKADLLSALYVASDDERIENACKKYNIPHIMTGECLSGSDRVRDAVRNLKADVIINIQGDEPLISPEVINAVIKPFLDDDEIHVVTAKKRIHAAEDIESPNIVKVITDISGDAVYFSRSVIPYNRDNEYIEYYKHIGIYAYTGKALDFFSSIERTPLETAENLEQLRFIENGWKIRVVNTLYDSIGVDTPEDIQKVEKILSSPPNFSI